MNKNTFLPLDLQFFGGQGEPQEPNNPAEPKESNEPNEPKTPAEPQEPNNQKEPNKPKEPAGKDPIMIPKTRFDQVKQELDALKRAQEEADRQAKEKQGEFQDLYKQTSEELNQTKEGYQQSQTRVEQLEGVMNSMLDSRLENIPDEYHDLIPDNLSPEQKLEWISKAESRGLFKDKSQEPLGGATNPGGQQQDLENMSVNQLLQQGYGK